MVGHFENLPREDHPSFEALFGPKYPHFQNFAYIPEDLSGNTFSFSISPIGKKKYRTGRRNAKAELGEVILITPEMFRSHP
jgi:hypothetical protein